MTVIADPPAITSVPAAAEDRLWQELTDEEMDFLMSDPLGGSLNAPTATVASVATETANQASMVSDTTA